MKERVRTQYASGKFYEKLAGWYLFFKGYKVLARRYKTYVGEIDLLVCKGKTLAAVEVKSRKKINDSYYALTSFQKRRIHRTLIIAHRQFPQFTQLRCDTVLISPYKWPIHITNAF